MPTSAQGYRRTMTEMGHHEQDAERVDLGAVPAGEEVSEADAAERVDEEPDEQKNHEDPVWDEEAYED